MFNFFDCVRYPIMSGRIILSGCLETMRQNISVWKFAISNGAFNKGGSYVYF